MGGISWPWRGLNPGNVSQPSQPASYHQAYFEDSDLWLYYPNAESDDQSRLQPAIAVQGVPDLGPDGAACAICLSADPVGAVELLCGHSHRFHERCIQDWCSVAGGPVTCPLCRSFLVTGGVREISL